MFGCTMALQMGGGPPERSFVHNVRTAGRAMEGPVIAPTVEAGVWRLLGDVVMNTSLGDITGCAGRAKAKFVQQVADNILAGGRCHHRPKRAGKPAEAAGRRKRHHRGGRDELSRLQVHPLR